MNESNRQRLLILFLPQEWRVYARRPHWEAMAQHAKVLVIEPPAGILTAWHRPRRIFDYFRERGKIRTADGRIYFFRPIQLAPPLVDFFIPPLSVIDRWLMKFQLRKILKKLENEFEQAVLFIVKVHQFHYSGIISPHCQCYEITDLYLMPLGHQELNEELIYTKRAVKFENKIIADSDLVLTTSRLIHEKLKPRVDHLHYLHNAVDYKHFVKSADESLEIPDDIKQFKRPRLGFIGYINHLIDYELIYKLAQQYPDASIFLIGSEQKITKVTKDEWYQQTRNLGNVFYAGFKDYECLPAYLKGFDVCLLPFRLNEWMRHSAPNKVYQYLASGKPIVSTNFPEIDNVKSAVYVAKDHQEFIKLVGAALKEDSEAKRAARKKIAFENSTENRAIRVMKILDDLLKQRQ